MLAEKNLKSGFAGPPRFADREKQRRATTLYGVAVVTAVAALVWIIVTAINQWGWSRLSVAASMLMIAVVCMVLATRGHTTLGSMLILGCGITAVTLHLALAGPDLAPTLGGYYVLVVAAGVLLGGFAAAAAALAGIATLVFFALSDQINMLPVVTSSQTEWDVVRANSVALIALALMLAFAARRTRAAFSNADDAVSQLELAHQAVIDSQDQVLRAQKLETVGAISGAVAHDFNNYLTIIDGYAHLIAEDDLPQEQSRRYAEEIVRAAERSAALTRQLLALGRQQVFEPRACNLDDLVKQSEKMLRRVLGVDRRLDLSLGCGDAVVNVDPAQIEQVLINLTINARDAVQPGDMVEIRTQCLELDGSSIALYPKMQPGSCVELVISDSGTGMSRETLDRVFEPFFTTKGLARGTGLGLSSVKAIIQRSDGAVRIESQLGVGTTVRCILPRVDEEVSPDHSVRRKELPSLAGRRLLLIEDDDMVRRLVERLLKHAGATVTATGEPRRVMETAPDLVANVDLAICDVVMPEFNGAEVAEALTKARPDLPILFISGYLEGIMVDQGILKPGVNLLQKPFTERQLVERIDSLLRPD